MFQAANHGHGFQFESARHGTESTPGDAVLATKGIQDKNHGTADNPTIVSPRTKHQQPDLSNEKPTANPATNKLPFVRSTTPVVSTRRGHFQILSKRANGSLTRYDEKRKYSSLVGPSTLPTLYAADIHELPAGESAPGPPFPSASTSSQRVWIWMVGGGGA